MSLKNFSFKKLSLSKQVIFAFLNLLGIIIILAVLIFYHLRLIENQNDFLTSNAVPKLAISSDVIKNVGFLELYVLKHVISSDTIQMNGFEKNIESIINRNSYELQKYEKLIHTEAGKKLYTKVVENREAYLKTTGELLVLSRKNHDKETIQIISKKQQPLFEQYQSSIDELANFIEAETKNIGEKSSSLISVTRKISNFLIGFGLIVGLSMGFIITGVARRLKRDNQMLRTEIVEKQQEGEEQQKLLLWRDALFEGSRDAIFITGLNSKFEDVNEAACELTGYSKKELIKMCIPDLHEDEDLQAYRQFFNRIIAGEEIVSEAKILRKNGSKIDVEFNNRRIIVADKTYMHTVARDISRRKQAEEELKKINTRLNTLIEAIPDIIYFKDIDRRNLVVNKAFEKFIGLSKDDLIEKTVEEILPKNLAEQCKKSDDEVYQKGMTVRNEESVINDNGDKIYFDTVKIPIFGDGEKVNGLLGLSRDITQIKKTEAALKYRIQIESLLASISKEFINIELDKVDIAINKALRLIGEFLKVDRSYIFMFSNDMSTMDCTHEWCAEGIEPFIQDSKDIPVDSLPLWFKRMQQKEIIFIPRIADLPEEASAEKQLCQEQGIQSIINIPIIYKNSLVGFIGYDSVRGEMSWSKEDIGITQLFCEILINGIERKENEIELKENEIRYQAIVEQSNEGIYLLDIETRKIIEANAAFQQMLGYEYNEILELSVYDFVLDDPELIDSIINKMVKEKETVHKERNYKKKDNSILNVEIGASVISYGGKEVLCTVVRDVTQRKLIEEKERRHLRDMAFLSKTIMEFVQLQPEEDIYKIIGENLKEIVNDAYIIISSFDFESSCTQIRSVHNFDNNISKINKLLGSNGLIGLKLSVNETGRNALISGKVMEVEGGLYELSFRQIPKPICNMIEKIINVGRTYAVGFSWQGELLGGVIILLKNETDIKNQELLETYINQAAIALQRKKAEDSLRESEEYYKRFFDEDLTADYISTPDGRLVACNPALVRIFGFESIEEAKNTNVNMLYTDKEARNKMMKLIEKEKKLEYYELELRRKDGTSLYVIANIFGEFNDKNELVRTKGYLFDDTKRKQLEEHLRQVQKMESVGTLAGGIAHDFNNILSIILGHASLLPVVKKDDEKLNQSVEAINKAVNRGTSLVRQILTFARKTSGVYESVNLNMIVEEIVKMLDETFPKIITFSLDLDKNIPNTSADHNQLHQALLNLSVNARDAMPEGGILSFTTKTIAGEELRKNFPEAKHKNYIYLCISDTGIGMDENTCKHIFEPFFTTKELGKGTGLGLPVVFGIVTSHQGFIDVNSKVGDGTSFNIYFPVVANNTNFDFVQDQEIEEAIGGNEIILFIEDEDMLRDLVIGILEGKGYRVLTAEDGKEGLEIYKQYKDEINLVLSDIGLPKIGGLELLQEIKKISPDIKIIFASGYLGPELKKEMIKAGGKEFIQKPYNPDQILRKIRELLDNA